MCVSYSTKDVQLDLIVKHIKGMDGVTILNDDKSAWHLIVTCPVLEDNEMYKQLYNAIVYYFTSSSDSSPARLVKSMFALRHTMCEYRRPTPCQNTVQITKLTQAAVTRNTLQLTKNKKCLYVALTVNQCIY